MSGNLRLNLSCGQTDIYPKAREAMHEPLPTPIYYPPFSEMEGACISQLRKLMHTDADVLLVTGSATYGEEAAMNSVLEKDDLCVTVNTGVFGQVLTDVARTVGARVEEIIVPPGRCVKVEQVREALRSHPDAKMLAAVHIETTTGTRNPVDEIGAMIRNEFPQILYMVDAVSSLGSVPLRIDEWGIDICCSSSQKCLNAPQGIAIVSIGQKAWQVIDDRKSAIPGLCLDLVTWRRWHTGVKNAREAELNRNAEVEEETEQVDTSFTAYKAAHGPSGSYVLMKALRASLEEILAEGEDAVLERHAAAGAAFRAGVRAMGLSTLADENAAAPCSTCVVMPGESFDVQGYMRTVWDEYGIATAGGSGVPDQLGYVGSRVGLMGFVANAVSVYALLEAMEAVLPRFGIQVKPGQAIPAAKTVYED